MTNDLCPTCELNHSRLGVSLEGSTLYREARGSAHRLRLAGGAWAFLASLIDQHLGEIERLQINDSESGIVYHVSIWDFMRHSFRQDLGSGEQLILPLRFWLTLDTRGGPFDAPMLQPSEREEIAAQLTQPKLFETPGPALYFRKGQGQRPRRALRRH